MLYLWLLKTGARKNAQLENKNRENDRQKLPKFRDVNL